MNGVLVCACVRGSERRQFAVGCEIIFMHIIQFENERFRFPLTPSLLIIVE